MVFCEHRGSFEFANLIKPLNSSIVSITFVNHQIFVSLVSCHVRSNGPGCLHQSFLFAIDSKLFKTDNSSQLTGINGRTLRSLKNTHHILQKVPAGRCFLQHCIFFFLLTSNQSCVYCCKVIS